MPNSTMYRAFSLHLDLAGHSGDGLPIQSLIGVPHAGAVHYRLCSSAWGMGDAS